MAYISNQELWDNLGKDAYTKVRSEIVGTGNGVTSTWSLDHDNVITSSLILYTGGVTTSGYTYDLDAGTIASLTVGSGSVLTADYNYGDIPDSQITKIIEMSDDLTETLTHRTFGQTTASTEYLDVESDQTIFWLRNYPVITISSVNWNTEILTDTPSWTTSAEGLGNDYLANSYDLSIGRIRFIDNFPYVGEDRLKITYDYGYTTTPSLVKELSTLIAMRNMANSAVYKAIFKGQDNFTPVRLAEIETRIQELVRVLRQEGATIA